MDVAPNRRMRWRAPRPWAIATVVFTALVGALVPVAAGANVGDVVITQQPTLAQNTVLEGNVATVTAAATGDPEPTVQWERSDDSGTTYVAIPGATSPSYSFTTVWTDDGAKFRALFTNAGGIAQTNNATLRVTPLFTITLHPANLTVAAGSTATFTTAARSGNFLTWQESTNNGTSWVNLANSNVTSFNLNAVTTAYDNRLYRAVWNGGAGTTRPARLTVVAAGTPYAQSPANAYPQLGGTASFASAAVGLTGTTVQWERAEPDSSTFAPIPGATDPTYSLTTTAADGRARFRAVFTNGVTTLTSPAADLIFAGAPSVTTNPTSRTTQPDTPTVLTAHSTGGVAPVTVQWQKQVDGGWVAIDGATSDDLTVTLARGDAPLTVRALFLSAGGDTPSLTATVALAVPYFIQQPTNRALASTASSVTFNVIAGDWVTMIWQRSTDNGATWADVPGSAATNTAGNTIQEKLLVVQRADAVDGARYRAVFTNALGSSISSSAVLTVAPIAPTISINSFTQPLQVGVPLTITATVTGSPAPLIQWQIVNKPFGLNWLDIGTASTTPSLTITTSEGLNGLQIRAVATNSAGSAIANTPTFNVVYPPRITTHPSSATVAAGTAVTFSAAAVGNPTPNSVVTWQRSTNGGQTWTTVFSFTSTLTLSGASVVPSLSGSMYRAQFTNSVGTTTTNAATLTVIGNVVPTVTPGRSLLQGDDLSVTFSCAPAASLASCTAGTIEGDAPSPIPPGFEPTTPLTSGGLLDTTTTGRRTVVVKAVDKLNRVTWTTAVFDVLPGGVYGTTVDGGVLSTGGLATTADPLTSTVRTPVGGFVRIIEGPTATPAPAGYAVFPQQSVITAPTQGSSTPLVTEFGLHSSMTQSSPAGIVVWRDGVAVPKCSATSGSTATPDPCVASRAAVSGGAKVTVRATTGGTWTFGVVTAVAPSAPTDVTATAGVRTATVTWTAPMSDGGAPLVSYTVNLVPAAGSAGSARSVVVPATTTTATLTGLVNGATYTVTVKALNQLVTTHGPNSAPIEPVRLPAVPAVPVITDATAGIRSATVTWDSVDSDRPVTSYTVVATATKPDGSVHRVTRTITGAPPATTTSITGLTPGLEYRFTVTATSAVGASSPSTPFGPVRLPAVPAVPVITDATAGIRSATVTWDSVDSDRPVTSYTVVATATKPDGSVHRVTRTITGAPPATTITITGLTPGLEYRFTVTATSVVGSSAPSAPSAPATIL